MSGEEAPAESSAAAVGEPMDLMTALQMVLKKSLAHDGLARGLHQGAKVIEKGTAQLCILAEDCDQPDYVKLVRALCADRSTNLITVPSAKTLGEWAGLCKIDSEGKARKVVGCSCVVVQDFGEESEGLHIVKEPSIIICDGPSSRNFGWRSHFNIDVRKMAYPNSVSVGGRLGFVNATIDCISWIKYNPYY